MRRILLLATLISSLSLSAEALPTSSFTRYSSENGLPMTTVQDAIQDANGYLWLASWSGLYRFDGKNFTNYRVASGNGSKENISNRIIDVEGDPFGNVLVLAYDNALYKLSPKDETMVRINKDGPPIIQMFKLSSDEMSFVTGSGQILKVTYRQDLGRYKMLNYFRLPERTTVYHIRKDAEGDIWTMTDKCLYKNGKSFLYLPAYEYLTMDGQLFFGSSRGRIIRISKGVPEIIYTNVNSDIRIMRNIPGTKKIVIGSGPGGIYTLDTETLDVISDGSIPFYSGDLISKIDVNGNIWLFSRNGGLYNFNPQKNEILPFFNPLMQHGWDAETNVTAFYPDRQGNLWIGGSWGGIERVTFNKDKFHIKKIVNSTEITPANSVRAMLQDSRGNIYAATKDKKIHLFNSSHTEVGVWSTPGPIYTMTQSRDGKIWMGMKTGGIMYASAQGMMQGEFNPRRFVKSDEFYGLSADMIYDLKEGPGGRLWIGSLDDGLSFLGLNGRYEQFISKKNRLSFPTEQRNSIRDIEFGPDGSLYACGTIGMFVCRDPGNDPEDMKFNHFKYVGDGYDVQEIMFSSSNNIYAATTGSGLLKFDSIDPDGRPTSFTTSDGLLSNIVLSTIEDYEGNIWIATFGGLNRLNPRTGSIIGYSYERLGLKSMLFNEGQPLMTKDSTIYFNTNSGVLFFRPKEIYNSNSYIPKIIVTSCYCSGDKIDADNSHGIRMRKNESLNMRFLAIDMTAQENVTYSYTLEGRDKGWTFLGSQPTITIKGLKRGKYTLILRSTNSDGIPVKNERTFTIKVSRSKIENSVLIALLLAVAAFLFTFYEVRKKQKEDGGESQDDSLLVAGMNAKDKKFVLTLKNYIYNNIDNSAISADTMAETLKMSRSAFFTKCKELLGKTPIDYLREIRFKKATELLESGEYTISQTAFMTGFNDSHYFSRAFRSYFGVTPSFYKKKITKKKPS